MCKTSPTQQVIDNVQIACPQCADACSTMCRYVVHSKQTLLNSVQTGASVVNAQFHVGTHYVILIFITIASQFRLWHSPCQRTPLGCN